MVYKPGDYFGELAILKDEPRAASVVAKTKIKATSLDRESFRRLIGPLDEILKRNMAKYQKFMWRKMSKTFLKKQKKLKIFRFKK